ncbi:FprA family A-type flavoprotein [Blautia hydrogenotrophica]|uniref:FprA family A-type flavoprotein n=1 Tax=Blautia hydrogenotrophica TaxID=53443 RepID=UPI0023F10E82|nr:FprA family A-type flavoprotein [Blautia hydrogenotrophica]
MYCTRKITDNITWVGGSDRRLALFENLFPISSGVAYNSYLIADEKTALVDTVDSSLSRQFLENIYHTLDGRSLDYLIVNHMEPDHCANIEELMFRFPEMKVIGNAKTLNFIRQFYDMELEGRTITVKEGDKLELGRHTLNFFFAPMVHWPEVMVSYEETEKILFAADAFGSFGALDGILFNDEVNFDRDWLDDARRYYSNIVGKYGSQVQAALKKLSALDIQTICPLHGPVWRTDLAYILDKYNHWSTYEPEDKSVVLIYGSMYGDTENAVNVLAAQLAEAGVKNIRVYDASSTHVSVLISEIFRSSHLVLASPTYNAGIYPAMLNLLHDMAALNIQNRTVGLIENGTWAPSAGKSMRTLLEGMKNMTILEPVATVKSALKKDSRDSLSQLKDALVASLNS